MYVCMYVSMYVSMYLCMYVCMYVCMCMYVSMYVMYVFVDQMKNYVVSGSPRPQVIQGFNGYDTIHAY